MWVSLLFESLPSKQQTSFTLTNRLIITLNCLVSTSFCTNIATIQTNCDTTKTTTTTTTDKSDQKFKRQQQQQQQHKPGPEAWSSFRHQWPKIGLSCSLQWGRKSWPPIRGNNLHKWWGWVRLAPIIFGAFSLASTNFSLKCGFHSILFPFYPVKP